MDCVSCADKYVSLCVHPCVKRVKGEKKNRLLSRQFTGPETATSTGQTDPQRERLVCRRAAKNTTLLTSAGQRQCSTTHCPPAWYSSKHEHMSTNTGGRRGRDPVGPEKTAAKINTQSEMEAKSRSGFFFLLKGLPEKAREQIKCYL